MAYRRKFMKAKSSEELTAEINRHFPHAISREDFKMVCPTLYGNNIKVLNWCRANFGAGAGILTKRVPGEPLALGIVRVEFWFDIKANYLFDWIEGFRFKSENDAVLFKLRWVG